MATRRIAIPMRNSAQNMRRLAEATRTKLSAGNSSARVRRYLNSRTAAIRTEAAATRWDAKNGFVSAEDGFVTNRDYTRDNAYLQGGSTGQTMDKGTRKSMKSFYYRQNRKANGLNAG